MFQGMDNQHYREVKQDKHLHWLHVIYGWSCRFMEDQFCCSCGENSLTVAQRRITGKILKMDKTNICQLVSLLTHSSIKHLSINYVQPILVDTEDLTMKK